MKHARSCTVNKGKTSKMRQEMREMRQTQTPTNPHDGRSARDTAKHLPAPPWAAKWRRDARIQPTRFGASVTQTFARSKPVPDVLISFSSFFVFRFFSFFYFSVFDRCAEQWWWLWIAGVVYSTKVPDNVETKYAVRTLHMTAYTMTHVLAELSPPAPIT